MLQFLMPNKVAFITSYPPGTCPIATFTSQLMESMIPAAYGAFEPVMIAVEPDISREYPEEVSFVIRKGFKSDYTEAADFINSGNGDVVLLQHHLDIFGTEGGLGIVSLLQQIDIPVISTLHTVPAKLPEHQFNSLVGICRASAKVIVMDKRDLETLNKQYGTALDKIELIFSDHSDNPFDRQKQWFHIGRQFWQLVSDQLHHYIGDVRSQQALREHALLFNQ